VAPTGHLFPVSTDPPADPVHLLSHCLWLEFLGIIVFNQTDPAMQMEAYGCDGW